MTQDRRTALDVVVVGGGVIGLAVAWRTAQCGLRVGVLDRSPDPAAPMGATHVAAGMLAPVSEADPGEPGLLELGLRSAERWPAFAAEVAAASGVDPGLRRCGTLLLARDRDEAEALERELELRRALGLSVRRLRPSEARRLEPALAPTLRLALAADEDHAVDPRALARALAGAAAAAGADLRGDTSVVGVVGDADRVTGVELEDGEVVAADRVVIAAGAWTAQLAGLPEDERASVRPVKGQILRLRDPDGAGLLSRVVRFEGGYLVPRGDGRYVLGATVEERGFDVTVTAGAVHDLLRDASELVPGVLELVVEETGAGLRPGTPDNAPILGASAAVAGLVWATGHHRNGVLLAPVTADLVAGAIAGEDVPDTVRPGRFSGGWARNPAGAVA